MKNRIRNCEIEIRRLSPAEAEVWLIVQAEQLTPSTDVRGKVTGPRCPGVTTVEVAYPLRPLPGIADTSGQTIRARILIPEPNLWTEHTPFVYEAQLELWQDGELAERTILQVGLKQSA
jgi:hypothetical protein